MRLRVLGPMELRSGQSWIPVRAPKQRILLATLLLGAGSPVSVDRLIDQVWPDRQPTDPANQIYLLVSRLRQLFGPDGRRVIRTMDPGYVLAPTADDSDASDGSDRSDDTDAARFERLRGLGTAALERGAASEALDALTEALALWRGPAYADVPACSTVAAEAARLEQTRLATLEARLDAELRLGRHAEVADELAALLDEHPFRERLGALLMLALYRSGRQAEALAAYQRTYRRLDEELGIQPGSELQDLQQRMLRADPTLDLGAATGDAAQRATRPAQLPTDRASMTGRGHELRQVLALADRAGRAPGMAIGAIDGMPGVGKTALAVHAGYRLAGQFPDGQVFLDLHGFTRSMAPLSPASGLDRLLRSIGVPGQEIPDDLDDRAALWRSLVANRRLLLLLDNAASEQQVRPLLPGSSACLVLITSRHRLGDLDDALSLSLDVLPRDDAQSLLRTAAGPGRLDEDIAERVDEAAELCGRLPLAVRLLAARLRKRPGWSLTDLLDRLRDRHTRVAELDSGQRSVAAAFDLSYEPLDKDQRRLFRLASLHPGADFDAGAAAALADLDVDAAERILEELVDLNLLRSGSYARYAFHDLIRAYATETTDDEDSESERAEASDRLLGFYASAAASAMDAIVPARRHLRPAIAPAPVRTPDFEDDGARALAWLDLERSNLIAVAGHAAGSGRGRLACQISLLISRYLHNGAYHDDAEILYEHHLNAARAERDRTEEARALWLLGSLSFYTSGRPVTLDYLRRALVCLPADDSVSRAALFGDLSAALRARSHFTEARDCLRSAVELYQQVDDPIGEANALCGLAEVAMVLGDFSAADTHGTRAVALATESGDRSITAYSHHSRGFVHIAIQRYDLAYEHLSAALRLYREDASRPAETIVMAQLCNALRGLGRFGEALRFGERALASAREIRHRNGEYEALQAIGDTLLAAGRTNEATVHLEHALDLAVELEQPMDQARAHHALGIAADDRGERTIAYEHWQLALDTYERLELPAANAVRARLITATQDTDSTESI